jgi:hypothetical protein
MSYALLAHSSHPLGGFFLARLPDSTFLAGQDEASARVYESARCLYDSMYPLAINGHHWAWNLCYEIESAVAD